MPSQLITTRFSASSTAADVVKGLDLQGVRAVVTGASSGLGVETARALAAAGASVTLAVRNPGAGANIAAQIEASTMRRPIAARLDLADVHSIASFVDAWDGEPSPV